MSSYFGNIRVAVTSLVDGMRVTLGHLINKKRLNATLQYPNEKWPIPERNIGFEESQYNVIRSRLHVDINDCIGCMQCVRACPVDCIVIDTIKLPKEVGLGEFPQSTQTNDTANGTAKKLLVTRFDIDMAECCYCNLCVYPCPEECIYMVGGPNGEKHEIDYEFSVRNRNGLVYEFSSATDDEVAELAQLVGTDNLREKRRERREGYLTAAAPVAEAVDVAVTDGAAEAESPKPKKKVLTEPKIDMTVLGELTDRVVRGLAKKSATGAVREGLDSPAVAAKVKADLEAAGKLTPEIEAVVAKLAEAAIERPGDEAPAAEAADVAAESAEPAPAEPAGEAAPAPAETAAPAEGGGGGAIDLTVLNGISDRMARGKAKAILNRVLKQGGSAGEAAGEIRAVLDGIGKLDSEAETILTSLEGQS